LLPDLLVPVDVVGCEGHAWKDIRHPFEQTSSKDVHEAKLPFRHVFEISRWWWPTKQARRDVCI